MAQRWEIVRFSICVCPQFGDSLKFSYLRLNKQNTFDDLKWAAKHLVAKKYTSHSKIAVVGDVTGALAVAAAVGQSPELFAAAVPNLGIFDLLRIQSFVRVVRNTVNLLLLLDLVLISSDSRNDY